MIKSLRIGTKIYLAASVLVGTILVTNSFAFMLAKDVGVRIDAIAEEDVPLTEAVTKLTIGQLEQAIIFEQAQISHLEESLEHASHEEIVKTVKSPTELRRSFLEIEKRNDIALADAKVLIERAIGHDPMSDELIPLQKQLHRLGGAHKVYVEHVLEAFDSLQDKGFAASSSMIAKVEKEQKTLDHDLEALLLEIEHHTLRLAKSAEEGEHLLIDVLLYSTIGGGLLGLAAAWLLFVAIARPVGAMAGVVSNLLRGETVDMPALDHKDELGELAHALQEIHGKAVEAAQIKTALDGCQTSVMLADEKLEVFYVNRVLQELLRNAQSEIRKDLPDFDVDRLIGTSIERFSNTPAEQKGHLASLTSSHETEMTFGGRIFGMVYSPIFGSNGERLGMVVEWQDQTNERTVEAEIDDVVAAAVAGDFTKRLVLEGKDGFMRTLAESINQLSSVVDQATGDLANMLETMAQGELTQRITSNYQGRLGQLKDNANQMAERLAEIVEQVKTATATVKNASVEISAGTEDLSNRTEQAASNLEETAATSEQMSATVKTNAESAKEASQLAEATNQIAVQGGSVAEQAVVAMGEIDGSAQKITDIIGVIDEIAFQTNLLALNASVEAARAGEAGKGFAVVAQEVRQLAQRSAQAASDIKTLIQNSNGQVKCGVQLVNQAGEALKEIVGSIGKVARIVREISGASQEQAEGVQEINSAVTSMDEMTQQNSALVEESAASARSLAEEAMKLTDLMDFFKLDVESIQPISQAHTVSASTSSKKRCSQLTIAGDDSWNEF
ncbi:MAG: methyl-accepting chemotaxis protein [Pseudomonadota bacterium]